MKRTIKIWRFEDAPEKYRRLSTNGGDEDWVAFVPIELGGLYIPWMEEGSSFGVCRVRYYKVKDGVIKIGCHA